MKRGVAQNVVYLVLLALLLSIIVLYLRLDDAHLLMAFGDFVFVMCAGIAAVTGLLAVDAYGTHSTQGKFLSLLALASVCDAVGGFIWAFFELGLNVVNPYPSPADAFFVLFYVFAIISLIYALVTARGYMKTGKAVVVGAIWLVIVIAAVMFVITPILADPEETGVVKALSVIYPIGDLVLAGLALLLFLSFEGSEVALSWGTFVLAYLLYTVADLGSSFMLYQGTYITGVPIDIFWYAGQLMMAAGFYRQIKLLR